TRRRWRELLTDKSAHMRVEEALCWMRNTGCSLEQLINPNQSLLTIYLTNQAEAEKQEKVSMYNML
ncbi:MAG: hypothetical protein AAF242_05265, partial [Bacteroidota bacterium]